MSRLNYVAHEGTGPGLLLVHGFLSSAGQWVANIEGLKTFSTPVVVDLWGHGRSPSPADPALYTIEAYIDQFEQIRAELGFDEWALCGASFGAGLTLQYAFTHPERVVRQVFTNSMSGLSRAADKPHERVARAEAIETGGREKLADMPFHPRFAKRLSPDVIAALGEDAERLNPIGVSRTIGITAGTLSAAARLGETRVPTLLVNGTWEKAFQPVRDWAVAALPSLQVVDLEGGHSINAELPDAFNAALKAFLQVA